MIRDKRSLYKFIVDDCILYHFLESLFSRSYQLVYDLICRTIQRIFVFSFPSFPFDILITQFSKESSRKYDSSVFSYKAKPSVFFRVMPFTVVPSKSESFQFIKISIKVKASVIFPIFKCFNIIIYLK